MQERLFTNQALTPKTRPVAVAEPAWVYHKLTVGSFERCPYGQCAQAVDCIGSRKMLAFEYRLTYRPMSRKRLDYTLPLIARLPAQVVSS